MAGPPRRRRCAPTAGRDRVKPFLARERTNRLVSCATIASLTRRPRAPTRLPQARRGYASGFRSGRKEPPPPSVHSAKSSARSPPPSPSAPAPSSSIPPPAPPPPPPPNPPAASPSASPEPAGGGPSRRAPLVLTAGVGLAAYYFSRDDDAAARRTRPGGAPDRARAIEPAPPRAPPRDAARATASKSNTTNVPIESESTSTSKTRRLREARGTTRLATRCFDRRRIPSSPPRSRRRSRGRRRRGGARRARKREEKEKGREKERRDRMERDSMTRREARGPAGGYGGSRGRGARGRSPARAVTFASRAATRALPRRAGHARVRRCRRGTRANRPQSARRGAAAIFFVFSRRLFGSLLHSAAAAITVPRTVFSRSQTNRSWVAARCSIYGASHTAGCLTARVATAAPRGRRRAGRHSARRNAFLVFLRFAAALSCRGHHRAANGLFTQPDEPLAGRRPLLNLWRFPHRRVVSWNSGVLTRGFTENAGRQSPRETPPVPETSPKPVI